METEHESKLAEQRAIFDQEKKDLDAFYQNQTSRLQRSLETTSQQLMKNETWLNEQLMQFEQEKERWEEEKQFLLSTQRQYEKQRKEEEEAMGANQEGSGIQEQQAGEQHVRVDMPSISLSFFIFLLCG